MTKSPEVMLALLTVTETFSTLPYRAKKAPSGLQKCLQAHQVSVTFVLRPPIYSIRRQTDKMPHNAFDRLARNFGPILRFFNASSIASLLTQINFRFFTSVVSLKIVLVLTGVSASIIVRNLFPLVYSAYYSCKCA